MISPSKIYRAEFKEPYAIETYYLRDLLKVRNQNNWLHIRSF